MQSPDQMELIDCRPRPPFRDWLSNTHSQCGEDGIIAHLLEAMGIENGYFVEFGAWDGRHLSNCAALADRGFAGCFIEGDSDRFLDLIAAYPDRNDIKRLNAFVEITGSNSLDSLLTGLDAPRELTVLSIDIDGLDYHVWESLVDHKPALCIVEFNPTIPAHVVFVQACDASVNHGSSLAALWMLGQQKGYSLVAVTDFNAFFILDQLCGTFRIPTYDPEAIKTRNLETAFFHGFDATVFTAGDNTMLWHGVPIRPESVQVMPESLRRFPIGRPPEYYKRLNYFRDFGEAQFAEVRVVPDRTHDDRELALTRPTSISGCLRIIRNLLPSMFNRTRRKFRR